MVSKKLILALLPAILLNAAIIYLFLFSGKSFVWDNALRAVAYALFLSVTFWGAYALVHRSWSGK